jgi:hypothetical protein
MAHRSGRKKSSYGVLGRFQLDESAIEAQAMRHCSSNLERLDRTLSLLESRRRKVLLEIEAYRATLAERLRQAAENIAGRTPNAEGYRCLRLRAADVERLWWYSGRIILSGAIAYSSTNCGAASSMCHITNIAGGGSATSRCSSSSLRRAAYRKMDLRLHCRLRGNCVSHSRGLLGRELVRDHRFGTHNIGYLQKDLGAALARIDLVRTRT